MSKVFVCFEIPSRDFDFVIKSIKDTLSENPPVSWEKNLLKSLDILEGSADQDDFKIGGTS
tara:strand:- start:154 stop:336 length:183 start_codon:yes stop_codon:yes gene_type:complete